MYVFTYVMYVCVCVYVMYARVWSACITCFVERPSHLLSVCAVCGVTYGVNRLSILRCIGAET